MKASVIRPRSQTSAASRSTNSSEHFEPKTLSAAQILSALERPVVGQSRSKARIAHLLAMHLNWFQGEDSLHRSPNALVMGPTGVGKTHTLRLASEVIGIPFVIADGTSLVPSGVVGEQVEDVLARLVASADAILRASSLPRIPDDDLALARHGVILIDEFDKLAARGENENAESVAAKRTVQRRLLKLLEGSVLRVGVKRHDQAYAERFLDTTGILVIAAGAFGGIDGGPIRSKRPASVTKYMVDPREVITADVVAYGFIPELAARVPILIQYDPLSASDLYEILARAEVSPIVVWERYYDSAFNADLRLDDACRRVIAERAAGLDMGARGLQQVVFPVLARQAESLTRTKKRQIMRFQASDFRRSSLLDAEPEGESV